MKTAIAIGEVALAVLTGCGSDDESTATAQDTGASTTTQTDGTTTGAYGFESYEGAGSSDDPTTEHTIEVKPESAKPKVSSVDILATCAQLFGQDVTSTGPPVAGFVPCLKRLDAPKDVIEAWGG